MPRTAQLAANCPTIISALIAECWSATVFSKTKL